MSIVSEFHEEYEQKLVSQIAHLQSRIIELETENAMLKRTFETWDEWFKQNFKPPTGSRIPIADFVS